MLDYLKTEILATWAAGSTFDRYIGGLFVACVPYDIWRGNWFDLVVACAAIIWVWQSIKRTATHD
jgi:hypothetical protein